ncbi:MAG: hypothetical protein ACE14V_03160 [bacterium]
MKSVYVILAVVLVLGLSTLSFGAFPKMIVFNGEGANPVTNSWINGGEGSQTTSIDSAIKLSGNSSIKWRYTLPVDPAGDYPTIEMAIPVNKQNWTGATTLGMWMYFDLTGTKTDWTIQPVLAHPYPTVDEMGNWNTGGTGITNNTWTWHEWVIPSGWSISNVSHMRIYYSANDGWAAIARSGNVDLYFDDIAVQGSLAIPVELIDFSSDIKH